MKKLRKRVFAAVLAALMLATAMPVTALYASAETGDIKDCICETPCTEDSINGDCSVCGAEGADLSGCTGEKTENSSEEDTEEADGEDIESEKPEDTDANLCAHHREHTTDCGYSEEDNTPCGYECRICPIEDLIAALPEQVTEDNADVVRARLDEILALYRELNEDEQGQLDLSRCYALQGALDGANAPTTADDSTEQQDTDEASVTINGETLYYATLKEAFAAANGKTATITMLTDAECVHSGSNGAPLNINSGTVKLNLNGKTLSGNGYGGQYHGIVDVSGGSLSVEGEGKVNVKDVGLSCRGSGKLTVGDITLNLITDTYYARAGVVNQGGTVILNGTQMTGAASDGQIDHYSGTTTINNVTATGTTESCPKSVWYEYEGTLKINSGTFEKIVVNNYDDNAPTIAGLLGEGCAYKKQGGTWATDDELAGLEISNVTVEKIPLTINPQGDTSWYYSTRQTHTLAMNAAPVDSGTVTYVWKNGGTELNCAEDTYTVPTGTPVGTYTYTCEATCDGYTLSHAFTFKIEQSGTKFEGGIKTYNGETETTSFTAGDTITVKATPTATGTTPQKAAARLQGGPNAGKMALYVGDMLVSSEAVDADANGIYTMNVSAADVLTLGGVKPNGNAITLTAKFVGNDNMAGAEGTVKVNISAVAKVTAGDTTSYYDNFQNAWSAAQSAGTATVTLLADVTLPNEKYVVVAGQQNITLNSPDGEKFTLSGSGGQTIKVTGGELIVENVTVKNTNAESHTNSGIHVLSGQTAKVTVGENATVTGSTGIYQESGSLAVHGTVEGTNVSGFGVLAPDVALTVEKGAKISGGNEGIRQTMGGSLTINGGTINGRVAGVHITEKVTATLSGGTFTGVGNSAVAIIGSSTTTMGNLLSTGYAIFKADGTAVERTETSTGPGTFTVKKCQHTGVEVADLGEGKHGLTCPYCGYSCSHDTILTATTSDTVITVNKGCKTDGCGYSEKLGTVKFTFENLVYRDSEARVSWTKDGPAASGVALKIDNADDYAIQREVTEYSCSLTDLFGTTPVTAGDYTLKVLFYDDSITGGKDVECELPFTVAPAPLTDSMVTLDETKVTYNGAEQKPALTVKQGDNTLTPETDYEVSYSRDKVATTDFTNAGTVTITIKGKGNYEGEIKKTYTIAPAELTIKANDQTIFFGQSIAAGADNTTVTGLCNGDRLESVTLTPSTGNVPGGRITPYGAVITNGEDQDVTGDYAITYQTGTLTISYMERPENILYNHEERKNCYGRSEVVISADGYTVSDAQNGEYKDSFIIPVPARTGTVTKTLYFSKDGGKSAGVEVTVNFDLTPPTGKVKVGAKWWETLLKTITFGHYAVKEYTVTIESNDTGGSKIGEIQYAILYDDEQYTNASELASAAGIPWTEYDSDSKPKVPVGSRCVVYGRLTDQAGNVTYISTEGILLDETPPAVGVVMGAVEAQTAEFIITLDEAADYYYVVLPGSAGAPEAENIIAGGTAVTGSAASGRGEVKEGQLTGGKATVNVTASNLTPGMEYTVYVTAVDKTVDLETGAAAGNIQKEVKAVRFTMKKLTQAAPILSYQADRTDENNVKITITPIDGAEYKFGDGDWGSENEKAGFTTSDTVKLAIRLKETDTHYQSSPQTMTVDLSKEDRKAPSAFSLKVVANGETDYTVTIPLTEGCEYSFDGETWSDVNVKTGVKVGETVTGYMRYKATDQYNTSIAVKGSATMPKFTGKTPVIPPAEENYEKQSGVSGGGNSGSSGNTTPVIPVIPPAINANPGTEPVKPGTGNTEKSGTGMRPGSGTGTPAQGTKQPFIKGEDGKIGWDVIRAEEEQAQEGSTINVDMNGSVVVPGDIFDSIKGKDITITFDMGSGILWSVDGKSITTDKAGDIDFSVKTETNAIPVDIVNNVTGERYSIQISLSYDGEFGFTAVLSIGLGRENEGYTASLYYYNESTGELEFICADTVAEDGTVSLAFTHASDYVIVIDGDEEESGMGETVQQTSAGTDENTGNVPESPKTGQKKKNVLWPIVAGIVALAGIAFAGVLAWKKKEENSSVKEDK